MSGATGAAALLTAAVKAAAPGADPAVWVPALAVAFQKFDFSNRNRIAVALGQFAVEAGAAFDEVSENLNYTTAERLVAVFPGHFATVAAAAPYLHAPEKLANCVYANKLGNGNTASGDGWRFRGGGLIQLTGRDEYAEFGVACGMSSEDAAEYCRTPEGAAMSGCWYLSSRGCLPLADGWCVSQVTRRVNGLAMLGNIRRIAAANAAVKAMGG